MPNNLILLVYMCGFFCLQQLFFCNFFPSLLGLFIDSGEREKKMHSMFVQFCLLLLVSCRWACFLFLKCQKRNSKVREKMTIFFFCVHLFSDFIVCTLYKGRCNSLLCTNKFRTIINISAFIIYEKNYLNEKKTTAQKYNALLPAFAPFSPQIQWDFLFSFYFSSIITLRALFPRLISIHFHGAADIEILQTHFTFWK